MIRPRARRRTARRAPAAPRTRNPAWPRAGRIRTRAIRGRAARRPVPPRSQVGLHHAQLGLELTPVHAGDVVGDLPPLELGALREFLGHGLGDRADALLAGGEAGEARLAD